AVEKSPMNRRGMANATFFSFFDLGVGIGAMVFGQLASMFGYYSIYLTAAGSVLLAMLFYVFLLLKTRQQVQSLVKKLSKMITLLNQLFFIYSFLVRQI